MKVLAIFAEAIKGPDSTFETNVPTWREWDRAHLPQHRFVAVDERKTLGWSALSRFSERREFAGVVECYTFVRADSRRKGVGTALLAALIGRPSPGLGRAGDGVPENAAALALHEKVGSAVVGTGRRRRHRGRWRDVLLLERRSPA